MTESRKQIVPYGSWPSPLSAARVTAGGLRLDQIQLDGEDVYWIEGRASEGGRSVIVKRSPSGEIVDVTPPGFNVRTRVHEYGGGAYVVHRGTVFFANFADQLIYQQVPGSTPKPITEASATHAAYADFRMDGARSRLIGVRECDGVNTIVAIPGDLLVSGADFYSDPIVSPDSKFLAWIQWNHPNMPWDGTELWVAVINPDGSIGSREKIAGGTEESIFQPEWSPDGALYFVSDRTGWWNLYRWRGVSIEPVHPMAAEFGKPQWTFSMVTYAFVDENRIAATYTEGGRWKLALVDPDARRFTPLDLPVEPVESIKADGDAIYFVGGSPSDAPAIYCYAKGGQLRALRSSSTDPIPRDWISVAEAVTYHVGDRDVHAFYYPPTNPDVTPLPGTYPPLIVVTHGGPTGATLDVLDPKVQFWTSRGFAVLDVNYSGSTGYGRPYRDRLKGQWGIVDVEDAVGGAQAMVAAKKADPERLIIRGGSAGGYTTLAALTFHDTFKSGASYYGISDLEVLQHDTHKFEARYNDSLIGPYPEAKETYRQRSPIHFTDRLSCPIILFQGLEDKVVPPNQSAMMAEAVRKKGLKVKYVTFEGEQHGFRKAENIIRSLEEELAFYRDVFAM
jgi:dipeptidyl aminopeptidase/acylaminoacyl peptidase